MREQVERLFRTIRRIRYLVNSDWFEDVYNKASEVDKKRLAKYLDDFNIVGLRKWVEDQMDLESLSYRQLRRLASMQLIPYYSTMTKDELIKTLRRLNANKEDT